MNGVYPHEIIYLVILISFSVIFISSSNYQQYLKCYLIFYIVLTVFYEILFHFLPFFYNMIYAIPITIFSVTASIFGGLGVILQEDKELRDNWKISSALTRIGAVLMIINLILFIWFFSSLFLDFNKLSFVSSNPINGLIATWMYRLLHFLFFIAGFYASRNIRSVSNRKEKILFILSILAIFLAILDGIFNISIKWPILYLGNIYFGFFFIFQTFMFIINLRKTKGSSISIIMYISLIWLIAAFFFSENIIVLTEFPSIFNKWLFWLYITGFLISFRYKKNNSSF